MTYKQANTILNKVLTSGERYAKAEVRPCEVVALEEHEVSVRLDYLTGKDIKMLTKISGKNFIIVRPGIDDKGAYVEFCIY